MVTVNVLIILLHFYLLLLVHSLIALSRLGGYPENADLNIISNLTVSKLEEKYFLKKNIIINMNAIIKIFY